MVQFAATFLNITVLDDNDNAPIFVNAPYSATLPEGPVETTRQILTISAEDADSGSNGAVVYSFAGGVNGDFELDPITVSNL